MIIIESLNEAKYESVSHLRLPLIPDNEAPNGKASTYSEEEKAKDSNALNEEVVRGQVIDQEVKVCSREYTIKYDILK